MDGVQGGTWDQVHLLATPAQATCIKSSEGPPLGWRAELTLGCVGQG